MSMISVFVCYFFLTKLFLCLFILFLLTPRSVPVVKTSLAPEVLPEIVQVNNSFSFGAVDRSRSSGGAPSHRRSSELMEVVPFLWHIDRGRGGAPRHQRLSKSTNSFSLGAESSSTMVAPPEVLWRVDRGTPSRQGRSGAPSHRRSSRGCPLGGCPESVVGGRPEITPHHWWVGLPLLSRLIVVVFCFDNFSNILFYFLTESVRRLLRQCLAGWLLLLLVSIIFLTI